VFDLDPGERAGILDCARVALLLKEALAARGLECFAKVSGSKGIQVYAPLHTAVTFQATRRFAHGLAEQFERRHPDQVVSKMAKDLREGKVFIDWSQNSDFKTTAAVYSLRASRESPFVSVPVAGQKRGGLGVGFRPCGGAGAHRKAGRSVRARARVETKTARGLGRGERVGGRPQAEADSSLFPQGLDQGVGEDIEVAA